MRVRILCEDRLTERFLRALCDEHGVRVVEVEIAPAGRGSAADWVLARYKHLIQRTRSKNFQRHLGLLVAIDGDVFGVDARLRQLADCLQSPPAVPPRDAEEPVALFVPSWCIETWILWLTGLAQPPETAQLKRNTPPAYQAPLQRLNADERALIRSAVKAWRSLDPAPPSLVSARVEGERVDI